MLKVFGHWLVSYEKEHFKALVAMCVHTLNSVIKELYNLKKVAYEFYVLCSVFVY